MQAMKVEAVPLPSAAASASAAAAASAASAVAAVKVDTKDDDDVDFLDFTNFMGASEEPSQVYNPSDILQRARQQTIADRTAEVPMAGSRMYGALAMDKQVSGTCACLVQQPPAGLLVLVMLPARPCPSVAPCCTHGCVAPM